VARGSEIGFALSENYLAAFPASMNASMLITRTPFRITLGGGGTDLPGYYSKHGGFVLAAALNKYMFIYLNTPIVDDLVRVKYSKSEMVEDVAELPAHPLPRGAAPVRHPAGDRVISMADVPAGTGLGSSSCYLVGLLNALHTLSRRPMTRQALAEEACHIELDVLAKTHRQTGPVSGGYGGVNGLAYRPRRNSGRGVALADAGVPGGPGKARVLLFYTGLSRSTEEILAGADARSSEGLFRRGNLLFADQRDRDWRSTRT